MKYEVYWTDKAINSFEELIEFMQKNYSHKEIETLLRQTETTIQNISLNPEMFKLSDKRKEIRKGFVNKYVSLFYRVFKRKKQIDLLRFWEIRQNPVKLNTL